MNHNNTKNKKKWSTVRISMLLKLRLQTVMRKKADREDRLVTERELATHAITTYCRKEEKKLGILKPIEEEAQL